MNDFDRDDPWKELDEKPTAAASFNGGALIGRMIVLLVCLVASLAILLAGLFAVTVAVRLARAIWTLS